MNPVEDIAYVRLGAPDLDLMESFLSDFGMARASRTDDTLYMRGAGPDPVVHVTERGESRQIGFALRVGDRDDLIMAANEFNTVVEQRSEPGGGLVVRTSDPDGNQVELVYGIQLNSGSTARVPHRFNPSQSRSRYNQTVRDESRPSHILRMGHIALHTANFGSMMVFYQDVLGMRISDSYYAGAPENMMAAFLHCGLGERFVDHHTVALIGDGRSGFEHFAYEVLDLDDLMVGNRYLESRARWSHSWGVGRHRDGSQIFDYWRDPFDNKIEHWTDGDLVNEAYLSSGRSFSPELAEETLAQWGPPLAPDFMR